MTPVPALARDWDLIREILIWAESGGAKEKRPTADELALCYNVSIMVEAGLIDGQGDIHRDLRTGQWEPMMAWVRKLTWKGQDFLEAVRKDTFWNHAKDQVKQHALPAVLDVLKAFAVAKVHQLTNGAGAGGSGRSTEV